MVELIFNTILIGLLGSLGGSDKFSLIWRRLGIPTTLFLLALLHNIPVTKAGLLYILVIPLSLGYGIPDKEDKGSLLGRFFKNITRYPSASLRAFIAFLLAIPFYFLACDKIVWGIMTGYLCLNWYIFGGDDIVDNEGQIVYLLVEDMIMYGALGFFATVIIKYCY